MDGILLFDKPPLWTSHDAVDFVRRRIGQRKVGHAGTLDPMATGLLVILLGKATQSSESLSGLDKEYEGCLTLGLRTDTQDFDGRIVESLETPAVPREALESACLAEEGERPQAPPDYSAVKTAGVKSYEMARRGIATGKKPRTIRVHRFGIVRYEWPDAYFIVRCSKGTYIRALCDSVGSRVGCGAALSCLRRTAVGPYRIESALKESDLTSRGLSYIRERLLEPPRSTEP